jgi:maltooligosyltrehalose trehalohydrolase
MRRDDVLVVVNAGEVEATVQVDEDCEVLFQTPAGVVLDDGVLTVPAHGGTLVAPPRNFS